MSLFIFQSLVLSELILETHCEVVQLLFLVEDHFQVQIVYLAFAVKQVDYLVFIWLLVVNNDVLEVCFGTLISSSVEELNGLEVSLFINFANGSN